MVRLFLGGVTTTTTTTTTTRGLSWLALSCNSLNASSYPDTTPPTITHINTQDYSQLQASLTNAMESMQTATNLAQVKSLSVLLQGAKASLSIISAEKVLATATDTNVRTQATKAISDAAYNIDRLMSTRKFYGYDLSPTGNGIYIALFGILLLFYICLTIKSRYGWFNICFICGFGLELLGYVGRIASLKDNSKIGCFALQNFCLITAPAFIMAGIYFIFSQVVTIYGAKYSILSPMWYSYFFITIDAFSFFLQALGEGLSAMSDKTKPPARAGNIIMLMGTIIQVFSMTAFMVFWVHFISCVYFRDRNRIDSDSPYKKKTLMNFFKMLLNVESAQTYKQKNLDSFYNVRYQGIRLRPLFPYYPLANAMGVVIIYIRCIYRVVELKQGYSGYLIDHEVFIFTLDSAMIALCGIIFIPFHPLFVFGKDNVIKLVNIKNDRESTITDKNFELTHKPNRVKSESFLSSQEKFGIQKPITPLYMF